MIEITCNPQSGFLNIHPSGNNFQDLLEIIKQCNCYYNKDVKAFVTEICNYKYIYDEFTFRLKSEFPNENELVEVSELTKRQVSDYFQSIKELKISSSRRKLNLSLMKYPPLVGIHPNENFQSVDLLRALNQNRFLFNWDMGLGKSYALTCLIENLRFYKLIDKSIIFSTNIGIYNLKDEILKFSTTLTSDDIFVINSLSQISFENRDIFNSSKYPYKIIIMTYDTFTGINDYYYDINNYPKSLPKKIEESENKILEMEKSLRKSYHLGMYEMSLTAYMKENKEYVMEKKNLAIMKDKMHPSRKTAYRGTFLPLKEWSGGKDIGMFLDESHSISIPSSLRSKSIKKNLGPILYRYEFTGTFADKYEKMYMQMLILDKDLVSGKSYQSWVESYCDVGNEYSERAINPNGWNLDKIGELNAKLLKIYASRRKMTECLNLPPNYDVPTINIDMTSSQREIYEGFVKAQIQLKKGNLNSSDCKSSKDTVLNMFQTFQNAVDNPKVIIKSKIFDLLPSDLQKNLKSFNYAKDSKKIEVLDNILSERVDEYNERGIVWYFHPDTKDEIATHFKKYNPVVVEAGLSNEELNAKIKEFQDNPEHKILIGSIIIMNTSITVTECSFNVYLERTYNYTMYSQSKGRIFRPGQTRITRNYTMSYKNSIDNLQLDNLHQKGDVINGLLNMDVIPQDVWKKIFNYNIGDKLVA